MQRVGIAGFLHESNTFLPVLTTRTHFEQASLTKGEALIHRWSNTHHELAGFLEGAKAFGFVPVPLMAAYAIPGGKIASQCFDQIVDEMVEALGAAPALDGLLVALHGATVSENFADADGEILRRFRLVLGQDVPIIVTLDLHANVSARMIAHSTAAVFYRSNPHLDQRQRGFEAAQLISRSLRHELRLVQSAEFPPMLINIARQHTDEAPARQLYEDVKNVMEWPGIVSASVALGFYYADVEEMGASFLAVADGDRELANKAARWMADRAWQRRHEFLAELQTPSEAVKRALQTSKAPVVLMDIGDNVGAGSPGDSTILLEEILKQNVPSALVILFDPQAVAACVTTGVRQQIELAVGGKTDKLHGDPIKLRARIRSICDGLFTETSVRHGAWGLMDQGLTVVLETEQRQTVVLTSLRMAPMSLEQILSLGIKPDQMKVILVKGVVGPRAAYAPVAGEFVLVDTPGITRADPASFNYHRRRQPIYPLELHAQYPI